MSEFKNGIFTGIMIAGGVLLLGFGILANAIEHAWEKQAIEHGAAQYNPETGQFEWIKKEAEGE